MRSPALALLACLGVCACGGEDGAAEAASGGSSGSSANAGAAGVGGRGGAAGAAGGGATGGSGGATDSACPTSHAATTSDGHDVIVCEDLFPQPPYVRPPADSSGAAFGASDGSRLWLRGQAPRTLSSEELVTMGLDVTGDVELVRYGFAVYRVTLDADGALLASEPAILIQDQAFLGLLAGKSAEGLISRHAPDAQNPNFDYEIEPTLPIRIRFDTIAPYPETGAGYDLVERSRLAVVVENLAAAVSDGAGACMPALTDVGAENPLDGQAAPQLGAFRVPSMHGPGDNELVIDGAPGVNHMTPSWMLLPHQLIGADAVIEFLQTDFAPHGNPLSMPALQLRLVTSGGDPC